MTRTALAIAVALALGLTANASEHKAETTCIVTTYDNGQVSVIGCDGVTFTSQKIIVPLPQDKQ